VISRKRKPQLVISCHADTCFPSHRLRRQDGHYLGPLDNFVGVHAVMNAFFSGRMNSPGLRIELTYGEEKGLLGAQEVLETLSPDDVIVVVDVTGTLTDSDLVIEKCASPEMQSFVTAALDGLSYDLHADCPDPVSTCDETDVYREKVDNVFFLGIPCHGGNYNSVAVSCKESSVTAASEALIRLLSEFNRGFGKPTHTKRTPPDARMGHLGTD
jgi:hypothetical protein